MAGLRSHALRLGLLEHLPGILPSAAGGIRRLAGGDRGNRLAPLDGWPSRLLAYASIFFVFLPIGSRATIVSVLVSRIARRAHYGPIFGRLGIGNSLGAGLGPILSGAIYDRTHSYMAIYLTGTGLLLIGLAALIVFVTMTRRRGRA